MPRVPDHRPLNGRVAGFGHVFVGLLQAMADDYGVLAMFDLTTARPGAEVISIRLFETDYAQGNAFELMGGRP